MNIRITYKSGTVVEINFPMDEATITGDSKPAAEQSAVVYQPEVETKAEEAIPAQETATKTWDESYNFPSNAAFESVEPLKLGEEGVGKAEDGKIGGVGERKEGDERGGEENQEHLRYFDTKCGTGYRLPEKLLKLFVSTYGQAFTDLELAAAEQWLVANARKRKTVLGTGRYLTSWLKRAYRNAQAAKRGTVPSSNLLAVTGGRNEGW